MSTKLGWLFLPLSISMERTESQLVELPVAIAHASSLFHDSGFMESLPKVKFYSNNWEELNHTLGRLMPQSLHMVPNSPSIHTPRLNCVCL